MTDADPNQTDGRIDRRNDDEIPEWAEEMADRIADAEAAASIDSPIPGVGAGAGVPKTDADEAAVEEGESDGDEDDGERVPDVPVEVVDEAERLTRHARDAVDEAAAEAYREQRDDLVSEHEYTPRIRDEDDTLVLYPDEWVEDGTVQFDRIEETERAVEVSLSGPGESDRFEAVADHNEAVVDRVAEEHGPDHAANARAFAAFMNNYYVREVESASPDEREEFLEEYYPRNAWPTETQQGIVEETLDLIDDCAADLS
ncbi:DUF7108 domain-containing protein [Haloparvum sp. PAK95]|uniref:DUF7108 domain-containing protein n=1 Tax=Haloparvum sp. PAK95 TaxID=3418962 RepID=UPI003D2ED0FA